MCGLTGLLCPKTDKDIKSYLSKMTSSLVHRGPDDEGIWTEESIGMGHRRLSIIDLSSSGKQPMNSNCGRFVLTFNGEIYNHLDLRVELEKQGHSTNWRGYSDTETLIEAIAHWGSMMLFVELEVCLLLLFGTRNKEISVLHEIG